jgi:hypothetical protein
MTVKIMAFPWSYYRYKTEERQVNPTLYLTTFWTTLTGLTTNETNWESTLLLPRIPSEAYEDAQGYLMTQELGIIGRGWF